MVQKGNVTPVQAKIGNLKTGLLLSLKLISRLIMMRQAVSFLGHPTMFCVWVLVFYITSKIRLASVNMFPPLFVPCCIL